MTAFFTIFGAALTGFGLVTDGNGRRSMLSSLQSSSEIDASSEWYRTGHSLGLTAGTTDWTWTTDCKCNAMISVAQPYLCFQI